MKLRKPFERRVALNIIGGEPLAHPDIEEILKYMNSEYNEKYSSKWKLSRVITTNGIMGPSVFARCADYIDYWTVSYHTESLPKQKEMTLANIDLLHTANKNFEVRVMAHSVDEFFNEAKNVHTTLQAKGINALFKPINNSTYNNEKVDYIKIFLKNDSIKENYSPSDGSGISCCSNRPLNINGDRKNKVIFLESSNFKDWYCALNLYFLSVRHDGNIFHNTACHLNYITQQIEPIGNVKNGSAVVEELRSRINSGKLPIIKCSKQSCFGCGMCAPKAKTKDDIITTLKMHLVDTSIIDI